MIIVHIHETNSNHIIECVSENVSTALKTYLEYSSPDPLEEMVTVQHHDTRVYGYFADEVCRLTLISETKSGCRYLATWHDR